MRIVHVCTVMAPFLVACHEVHSPADPNFDASVQPAVTVTMIDIGTMGGSSSQAYDVNDSGVVAGWSELADGSIHAFRWTQASGFLDLGALGPSSQGLGINLVGDVVGYTTITPEGHAFRWTLSGGMLDIGTLPTPTRDYSAAWGGINDSGYVAGEGYNSNGDLHAIRWTPNGAALDLGALPGGSSSQALAINNKGWVTGSADAAGEQHAFLWKPGNGMQDLGRLGGTLAGYATDVNDNGAISGVRASPKNRAVFRAAGGALTAIPTLASNASSRAISLNNKGIVVGWSGSKPGGGQGSMHGFAWSRSMGLVDLGVGTWKTSFATRISNTNWVSGVVNGPNPSTGICCVDRAVLWRIQ